MTEDWTDGLVTVVYFIVGLGGVAGGVEVGEFLAAHDLPSNSRVAAATSCWRISVSPTRKSSSSFRTPDSGA